MSPTTSSWSHGSVPGTPARRGSARGWIGGARLGGRPALPSSSCSEKRATSPRIHALAAARCSGVMSSYLTPSVVSSSSPTPATRTKSRRTRAAVFAFCPSPCALWIAASRRKHSARPTPRWTSSRSPPASRPPSDHLDCLGVGQLLRAPTEQVGDLARPRMERGRRGGGSGRSQAPPRDEEPGGKGLPSPSEANVIRRRSST
jgi:hypothetical protein